MKTSGSASTQLDHVLNESSDSQSRGSVSMTEYFTKLRTISDGLALAGSPLNNTDLITHLITGLDHSYYPVVVYIEANMLTMDLSEAYAMLLTHEARLETKGNGKNQNNWNKNGGGNWNQNTGGRGGYQGQGRGNWNQNFNAGRGFAGGFNTGGNFNNGGFSGNFNNGNANAGGFGRGGFGGNRKNFAQGSVMCQICFRFNHTAAECRDRFNRNFAPSFPVQGYHPNQGPKSAYMATSEGVADQGWYLDSGATHHLTNSVQNLTDGKTYFGTNSLLVGNDQGLQITHIGNACLYTSFGSCIHLHDILCVPKITKNLISISKLLSDSDITIEVSFDACFLKDKVKGTLLAQGIIEGELYKLLSYGESFSFNTSVFQPSSMVSVFSSQQTCVDPLFEKIKSSFPVSFHVSSNVSVSLLHNRLGHPSKHVLQTLLRNNCITFTCDNKQKLEFCNACQLGKLHQFHFSATDIKSKYPLELIHTDLWGPASVLSMEGYSYYISFVDDYTRYCWIFPLVLKSDALGTFKNFKTLVEKQFSLPIKALQYDMGGEFKAFISFLHQEGIQFRHSYPHTHHQNGVVERKHRHIIETGLTLLAQAQMPISYWWEAFHTASYLINRMPTTVLNNQSPYQKLFQQLPNYDFLRVFGSACYPLLRPYNQHKLDFHSQKCLFIGYSPLHKGYKCLDKTRRVFIAIHVTFNEHEFPYSELFLSSDYSSKSVQISSPSFCILHDSSSTQQLSTSSSVPAVSPTLNSLSLPHINTPPSPLSSNAHSHTSNQNSSVALPQQSLPIVFAHPMVTIAKAGIFKPKTYRTTIQDVEPASVKAALADQKWYMAMTDELHALRNNETWTLVPAELATKIVGNKWVFRVKYNPDGSVSKYKARLVAKGFHQTYGVDFFETFSPVVKPCTIRIILSLAVMNHWTIRQLDVNNAFLNDILTEEVFMHQPEGFIDSQHPTYVCKLNKALYGLKQAPRACAQIEKIIALIGSEFALKDLGDFNYFIGLEVTPTSAGLHLSQTKYVGDILKKAHMLDSKGCNTLMSVADKLYKDKGKLFENPSLYKSVIGSLQYVTLTRPDIAFIVNKLSQFLVAPTMLHWQACKRVLRYLQCTTTYGIQFYNSKSFSLTAFSDADWGSDPDDRRSVGGYCIFLGSNLVSWSSKKQNVVSQSSTELEYRALALTTSEVLWISYLLQELRVQLTNTPVLYCDNKSAEALASNPKYHSRTKHIELDIYFVREHIAKKEFVVEHVSSSNQLANVLTKPLGFDHFAYMRAKLNVCPRP
ncbi:retrovirus-related pol polyprotein from transposon RE1 [Citrus sinensis]|nr:retrovirus-related pol polyprotein from transposon RE1 [Citrus sinensis]